MVSTVHLSRPMPDEPTNWELSRGLAGKTTQVERAADLSERAERMERVAAKTIGVTHKDLSAVLDGHSLDLLKKDGKVFEVSKKLEHNSTPCPTAARWSSAT